MSLRDEGGWGRWTDSRVLFSTGWRRLIGSPKLQIIFHKRATRHRALLLKITYKDKGSYESSPPCTPVFDVIIDVSLFLDSSSDKVGGRGGWGWVRGEGGGRGWGVRGEYRTLIAERYAGGS